MKSEKVIKSFFVFVTMLLVGAACKKDHGGVPGPGIDTIPGENAQAIAVMKEASEVIEKVYQDQKAVLEVNAAIRSGYYHDERVLLKDLLLPDASDLYQSTAFKVLAVDTGYFRRLFCEIVVKGNYPKLRAELKTIAGPVKRSTAVLQSQSVINIAAGIFSATAPLAIYFPYSENFALLSVADSFPPGSKLAIMRMPTLVYSDREADSGNGRVAYYCSESPGNICYRQVLVDDNYAFAKPTHIITVGAVNNRGSNVTVPKTELVHRVYHGASRLTRQMDRLISFTGNGGGSEIKICRVNGYLRRVGEQIDDFTGDVVTLYYTRGEIRNKIWKRVFSVWDPNWNYQDIEQIYAVFEEDTKGSKTINGSLNTTLNLPSKLGKVDGQIGFKIEMNTQDEIITQRKLDRKSYFRDGLNNQGWGTFADNSDFLPGTQDWPIYDGGSIWQYTLPYRIY